MSVYIRAADLPLWERAEDYARRNRLAVSALVLAALETYLAEHDPPARPRRR